MSNALAIANADAIEAQADAAAVWSVRLSDCTAEQRQSLIDFHSSVAALLRQRHHQVRAAVVHRDGGEFLTLRIRRGPGWRVPDHELG